MNHKPYWEAGMSYSEYRELIDSLLANGKTTGSDHSDGMINYTLMNVKRMQRWDKTLRLAEEIKEDLKQMQHQENWLVITEAWCGDAAQIVPVLAKVAEQSENIALRLILRDEYPDLMDAYLTNGVSKSIPILVRMDADFAPIGKWGPRPATAQRMVMDAKEQGTDPKEAKEALHLWYARNRAEEIQEEILEMIR